MESSVLDVGAGDGLLAAELARRRPDTTVKGIDVIVRNRTHVPVEPFDGESIPYKDDTFDAVLLVDVLHHTLRPEHLLAESARVAQRAIVIKDHILEGFAARPTLSFMDRVSNRRYGVALPNNYWSRSEWQHAFDSLSARIGAWEEGLHLYPMPADLVFGRSLHFVARLDLVDPEGQS